ncbi:ABC transporter ATP-binding protein [Corticibacter populi]|uniref:ABC transporter ATP-binding protein n=1 Tax=Corticibacter populi TaxID=1550736 RepID=A0A3M6QX68_9BURK|nr:ABC transporter ATP-binding protein [Corticibacter populi]RMX07607.1 ABC transporter ATP-binding protein [Corticibacter populi]RZS30106.1 amino acid/amide ABC transporter ATP-binding protein 2 (HAAT family) [Corticibacter populi]
MNQTDTANQPAAVAPGDAAALLSVRKLGASYGHIDAIFDIDIEVGQGQIVTVIGPNGAGKTTTLSAIMGVLPARGQVLLDGRDLAGTSIEEHVMHGMALVPETRALFSSMSVQDNLELGAFRFRHGPRQEREAALEEVYALFPRLKERSRQEAGTLSGGERQMLAVGRALMGKPRLLMLDEPSLGLAPLIVRDIFRIIAALRERGVSILLIEQNARAALNVADHAYVLELGRVIMQGPARELAHDPRVIEAYLGSAGRHQELLST